MLRLIFKLHGTDMLQINVISCEMFDQVFFSQFFAAPIPLFFFLT